MYQKLAEVAQREDVYVLQRRLQQLKDRPLAECPQMESYSSCAGLTIIGHFKWFFQLVEQGHVNLCTQLKVEPIESRSVGRSLEHRLQIA